MKCQSYVNRGFRSYGFSLIELMIVIAIAAILMGIAIPSFQTMLQNQRQTTTVNDFFSAINLTRAKAIERGGRVYMRPADGTNWAAGWVIFVNPAGDANKLYTATDTLISSHDAVPVGITISTAFSVSATGIGEYIAYDGTGRPVNEAAAGAPVSNRFGNVTFLQDGKARCIFVNLLGRPRVYKSLTTTCTATS